MIYDDITSVYNTKHKKKQAAKMLRDAIAHAEKLCDTNNPFISITTVSLDTKNTWCDGEIHLKGDGNDLGVIYHEVFHSTFHGSAIWKYDEKHPRKVWGDAFCDAFRYLMQIKYKLTGVDDKKFMGKFRKCLRKRDIDITAQDSYKELGSRIIIHLRSPSFNRYRYLWNLLNKEAAETDFNLYKFFGLNHLVI